MEQIVPIDEDDIWNAIVARNAEYDGVFCYGVITTGIYCVPSCPSKRPARSSVRIFGNNEDAQAAGFRACKRCKPDEIVERMQKIHEVMSVLERSQNEILSPSQWAASAGLSLDTLRKLTIAYAGLSPRDIIHHKKMNAFKLSIKNGNEISASQYDAGFGSSSRLYEKASTLLGMTPRQYKEKGKNVRIHYAIFETKLGMAIIAGTEKGICSLQFDDSSDTLFDLLQNEFSKAELVNDSETLSCWIKMLNDYLDGNCKKLSIPLDVHTTAFRAKVWEAIRRIPYGETRSYSRLAKEIGEPKAARAVAAACAANPVALVTPCHRVIHEDGKTSGYRWGIKRKKILLSMEKENAE